MKKRVDRDEWWPVWYFDDTGTWEIEVTEEFVARYTKVSQEFQQVMGELGDMVERVTNAQNSQAKDGER